MAQSVERVLGKDEVTSSILVSSSRQIPENDITKPFSGIYLFYDMYKTIEKFLKNLKKRE